MLSAPVVQWIERQPPKLEMWVRLPPGANLKNLAFAGLFIEAGSRQTAGKTRIKRTALPNWYNTDMGIEEIEQKDYFSIGDVKRITGVPEYSVRYWEAEFGLIRPIRLESGHRRYTKEDVYTILKIKDLIYKHKLTLEGAKKQLSKYQFPTASKTEKAHSDVKLLTEIKEILEELLK